MGYIHAIDVNHTMLFASLESVRSHVEESILRGESFHSNLEDAKLMILMQLHGDA